MAEFTIKLEGVDTKVVINEKLTFKHIKAVLSKGINIDPEKGTKIDIGELILGMASSVIVSPPILKDPKYLENIDIEEFGELVTEVQKVIPLEKFFKMMELATGQGS